MSRSSLGASVDSVTGRFDWSLNRGNWGIDIKARTARLFDGGEAKFVTTNIASAGRATAGVLSLPEAELEKFKNKPVYLMSFRVSQRDILESVMRATGTTEADWNIRIVDSAEAVKAAREQLAKGNHSKATDMHYIPHLLEGRGGDYSAKAVDMAWLGVEPDDLDATVKRVAEKIEGQK